MCLDVLFKTIEENNPFRFPFWLSFNTISPRFRIYTDGRLSTFEKKK